MASAKDIHLRQLILHEHRLGSDEKTACKNICDKLGSKVITVSKIKYWYKRFQGGDTSVFNKSSYFHRLKNGSQTGRDHRQLLMQFKDKRLSGQMTTLDGRIFVFSKGYSANAKEQLVLVDLFHGMVRPLTIVDPSTKKKTIYRRIEMIDQLHFLAMEFVSARLILYKLNYLERKVEALHSVPIREMKYGDFVVNSVDKRQFVLTLDDDFCVGHLDGEDKLVVGSRQSLDLEGFDFKEFNNNRLVDLRNVQQIDGNLSCDLCEYDLNGMEIRTKKVPMVLSNGQVVENIQESCYAWLDNSVYVASKDKNGQFKVLKLNINTVEWSDTSTKVPHPITEIFVDEHEILTVRSEEKKSGLVDFYRFQLRTPDTLKNLVWFAIIRESKFGESDVYGQVITHLPLNDELRCRLLAQ